MVLKCAAFGCHTGYDTEQLDAESGEKVSTFYFPLKKPELLEQWVRFVNRGASWVATKHSVLCEKHFEEHFIRRGTRNTLIWKLFPVPTIHSSEALRTPSCLPTAQSTRKEPTQRNVHPDQLTDFLDSDIIRVFSDVNPDSDCPPGFTYQLQAGSAIVFYRLVFHPVTSFPEIQECIRVDSELHVQLRYNDRPLPLPKWFVQGHNAKLTRRSMLENFPSYIKSTASEHPLPILDELQKRQFFKPKGRPPFSVEMIRYALLLRYTSAQAYRLLLEQFPLPSFSLLSKLHGGVDSVKAAKLLLEKKEISTDIILIADEMYLQKEEQFHALQRVGANEEGELYKGIVLFMITGLKASVPLVVRASPEVTINGTWLYQQFVSCLEDLYKCGFSVRGIVVDNHSTNVSAFKFLLSSYPGDKLHYFIFPGSSIRIYVFFDTVHLLKNIRNSLLNRRQFVFPDFEFSVCGITLSSPAGFITWSDIHKIYDLDKSLDANLTKAPKLTYSALHPGNNKQNVDLAIAIFHESTIAACASYFPHRVDMSSFLKLISTWWSIANSKERFTPNVLTNAITPDDGKLSFYNEFAD